MHTKTETKSTPEEDEAFVELFKKEHNEQFHVLVKMHLSFLLNMTTEESDCFYEKLKPKKWSIGIGTFGKKSKKHLSTENLVLSDEYLLYVNQLVTFLDQEENLKSDGIFRRTGSIERQQDLKNLVLNGSSIPQEESPYSVHDAASVLKGFLAELPEPVLTDVHFPVYCQMAELKTTHHAENGDSTQEEKMLQAIQLLIILLPKENKELLRVVLGLLYKVSLHESENRMSPENLAKLFTPHLLCPRKLSPEILLKDSQMLFGVVAFMIRNFGDIFLIPSQLMLDFRTHYEQGTVLNESVKGAAHTVFTFVDKKLTFKINEENPTETALAQLYAHIQSLPESSKKRKLVKQFNKENGQGTPLQVLRSSVPKKASIGDSLKKAMFHNKIMRKFEFSHIKKSNSEEVLNSPHVTQNQKSTPTRRLFCHNSESSPEEGATTCGDTCTKTPKILKKRSFRSAGNLRRSKSDTSLSELTEDDLEVGVQYLTSTPACLPLRTREGEIFTPEASQDRDSMSPITRSAQRMPLAMQETMMTPRSRKPVLLVSGSNINNLGKVEPAALLMEDLREETLEEVREVKENIEPSNSHLEKPLNFKKKSKSEGCIDTEPSNKVPKLNQSDTPHGSLTVTFKDYLHSRDIFTLSKDDISMDSSFSSRTDDFNSTQSQINSIEYHSLREISSDERFSDSMLYILDGNEPQSDKDDSRLENDDSSSLEKELVLKPRQFDEDGNAVVFETSF